MTKRTVLAYLDASGSMGGVRMALAQQFALDLALYAHLSGNRAHIYLFGSPGDLAYCSQLETADYVHTLAKPFYSGTDFNQIVKNIMTHIDEAVVDPGQFGVDVCVITDGECTLTTDAYNQLMANRSMIRLHLVHLGKLSSSSLKPFATSVHDYNDNRLSSLFPNVKNEIERPWPQATEDASASTIRDTVREVVEEILGEDVTGSLSDMIKGVTRLVDVAVESVRLPSFLAEYQADADPKKVQWWQAEEPSTAHAFRDQSDGANSVCGMLKMHRRLKPVDDTRSAKTCKTCEQRLA